MGDDGSETVNLSPASVLDPSGAVRSVSLASQQVAPETTTGLLTPTSITLVPRGSMLQPIAPKPGEPVDLAPQNPANLSRPQVAPVVPPHSVARPVQVAQDERKYPGQGQGLFGSNQQITPDTSDPNANPLEMEKQGLIARRDRLNSISSNKTFQFMNQGTSMKMQEEVARLNGQISQKDQQLQQQKTMQQYAKNFNLTKQMDATSDAAAVHEEALDEWRKNGNYKAFIGLHGAGQGARADQYAAEGMAKLGQNVAKATDMYGLLDNAKSEADYAVQRQKVMDRIKGNFAVRDFGLTEGNIPKTQKEYMDSRTLIKNGMNAPTQFLNKYQRQIQNQAIPQVITKEEVAKPVREQFGFQSGQPFSNTEAVTLGDMGDLQGARIKSANSRDLSLYGPGPGQGRWDTMTDDVRKKIKEAYSSEEEKGVIQKYKMAQDFWETAHNPDMYNAPAGLAMISDMLGAIGRDVAEGSKAAGSIGLSKMLEDKYGSFEKFMNHATNNWAAYKAYVAGGRKGEEVKLQPRLTDQSIAGIKMVADFKKEQALSQVNRLNGPTRQLGLHGGSLDDVGLSPELQAALTDVHSAAVMEGRLAIDSKPHVVRGTQRIMLNEDTTGEGVIPAGTYAASTKAIPATPPTKTEAPVTPTAPGGDPIQQFANGIKAGESGHRYDLAPGPKSTASGAYQFTDDTWSDFRPPNSPDKAYLATPKQQDEAFLKFTQKNSEMLTKGGVPVNSLTLAMAHQQRGDAVKLAKAPEGAMAKDFVSKEGAANNQPFFWDKEGNPLTVAQSKAKFAQHYRTGGVHPTTPEGGTVVAGGVAGGGTATADVPAAAQPVPTGSFLNPKNALKAIQDKATAAGAQKLMQDAPDYAPAVLGTTGTVVGGAVGGPPGAVIGGTLGGGIGGYIKNANRPAEDRTWGNLAGDVGFGGATGAVSAAPGTGVLPMAARAIGMGGISAGEKAAEGGTAGEVATAGVGGAVGSVGGEVFGQMLGKTGHMIYSRFSNVDKTEIRDAAKILSEQKPKNTLADGSTVENKAYTKAEQTVKDAGLDPEHAAYAHEQAAKRASKGEAFAGRPGEVARAKAGAELEDVRNTVSDTAATAGVKPKPTPANTFIPDGPASMLLTKGNPKGTLAAVYAPEAGHAEFMLQKPVQNAGQRFDNAAEARTFLLNEERKAIRDGDKNRQDAMRALADNVREYQEKMVKTILPKVHADVILDNLKQASDRYRRAILAGGDDLVETIVKGGSKGHTAREAFDAVAQGDPSATRMVNALTSMAGRTTGGQATLLSVMATASGALSFVPVVGPVAATALGVVTLAKAKQAISDFAVRKGAAQKVSFKDLLLKDITPLKTQMRQGGAVIGGTAGANAANAAVAP